MSVGRWIPQILLLSHPRDRARRFGALSIEGGSRKMMPEGTDVTDMITSSSSPIPSTLTPFRHLVNHKSPKWSYYSSPALPHHRDTVVRKRAPSSRPPSESVHKCVVKRSAKSILVPQLFLSSDITRIFHTFPPLRCKPFQKRTRHLLPSGKATKMDHKPMSSCDGGP